MSSKRNPLPPPSWPLTPNEWNKLSAKEKKTALRILEKIRSDYTLSEAQLNRRATPFVIKNPLGVEKDLSKKDRAKLKKIRDQLAAERRDTLQQPNVMRLPGYIDRFNPKDPRTWPPKYGSRRPKGSQRRGAR